MRYRQLRESRTPEVGKFGATWWEMCPRLGEKQSPQVSESTFSKWAGREERKPGSIRGGKVGDQQPRASYQIRAMGGILAGLTRATPTGPSGPTRLAQISSIELKLIRNNEERVKLLTCEKSKHIGMSSLSYKHSPSGRLTVFLRVGNVSIVVVQII